MESHPLVYIRTDGNETIATGHLMRCLSIARALKKRGAAVAFLVSDDTSASILQKMYSPDEIADHSFPILELRTDYRSLDREIQTMQGILSSHNVACLLVDSYFATPEYLDILRQICKVAYLDDLQAFDCPGAVCRSALPSLGAGKRPISFHRRHRSLPYRRQYVKTSLRIGRLEGCFLPRPDRSHACPPRRACRHGRKRQPHCPA